MKLFIYVFCLSLLLTEISHAVAINWTNAAGGDWNVAQNWNPNQVPGSNDMVTIPSFAKAVNVFISVTNSAFGITLNAPCSLTILSNAVLNISGATTLSSPLTNQGTVNWQAGNIKILSNSTPSLKMFGVIWNSAGALWNVQCDQSIIGSGANQEIFHNAGLIHKTLTAGTNTISVYLDNQGTVEAETGFIEIRNGGNLSGTFLGQVGILSTTPGITGAFSGAFNIYGGGIANGSQWTVLTNGTLNLLGNINLYGALTNEGVVNWEAGQLNMQYPSPNVPPGEIWNMSGALWNIQCDQSIQVFGNPTMIPNFHNAGLLRKSASTNSTLLPVIMSNSGTIEAMTGAIHLQNGGTLGGTLQADAGAGLFLDYSGIAPIQNITFTLNNPLCVGPGQVGVAGIKANLNGSFVGTFGLFANANFGTGSSFTVPAGSVLYTYSNTTIFGPFTNQGTVIWKSGHVEIFNNGSTNSTGEIWNNQGALWDIQCDVPTLGNVIPGFGLFHNFGVFRKSATTGTTAFGFSFDNEGTVQCQSGLIEFTNSYSSTAAATLALSIGGVSPGTGFGHVQMDMTPVLAGGLSIITTNGYLPNLGDTFSVLSYPAATGDFAYINGLDLGNGLQFTPLFSSQGLTLSATHYTTGSAPQLSLFHANSGVFISWPASFNGWELLSTTNLANPNWSTISVAGQNNTVISTAPPQQFFQLRSN